MRQQILDPSLVIKIQGIANRIRTIKEFPSLAFVVSKELIRQLKLKDCTIYILGESNALKLLKKASNKNIKTGKLQYWFPFYNGAEQTIQGFILLSVTKQLSPSQHEILNMVTDKLSSTYALIQLLEQNEKDPLTGILNVRMFNKYLHDKLIDADQKGKDLGLIMIDIDHFGEVNKLYGETAGDKVLSSVANKIMEVAGTKNLTSRIGGEEFAVIVPNINRKGLESLAEKIRHEVEKLKIFHKSNEIQVTLSIGFVNYSETANTEEEILEKADIAMRTAKFLKGRNQISSYEEFEQLETKQKGALKKAYNEDKIRRTIEEYYESKRGNFINNFDLLNLDITIQILDPKGNKVLICEKRKMLPKKDGVEGFVLKYDSDGKLDNFHSHNTRIENIVKAPNTNRWYVDMVFNKRMRRSEEVNIGLSAIHMDAFTKSTEYWTQNLTEYKPSFQFSITVKFPRKRICRTCKVLLISAMDKILDEIPLEPNEQVSYKSNIESPIKLKLEWDWGK